MLSGCIGMEKEKLIVSACLLGENTRYDGGACPLAMRILDGLYDKFDVFPVCPEYLSGLPVPRLPSEIEPGRTGEDVLSLNAKVFSSCGGDLTTEFLKGAESAGKTAADNNIRKALLKERSPSCGKKFIYDGTFSGKIVEGSGVTATLLKNQGVEIFSEEELESLAGKIPWY